MKLAPGAKIRPDLDSFADEIHRAKMATCCHPLRTCCGKGDQMCSDLDSNADVDLISALIIVEIDVCLVLGR